MLRTLSVENYALIDRLEMTLGPGLNIVTGETGAGKSILLGALGLLLGTRSEAGVQKNPERACVVEGTFEIADYDLETFFAGHDIEHAAQTIVRRVISAAGKSRAYVNDLPVGLGVLRELGERLIDIHSQHENLLLRDDNFRIAILDGAAGQGALVKRYGEAFAAWGGMRRELAEARTKASESRKDEDWLRHQVGELTAMRLREGEQEALEAEDRELSNSGELREAFGLIAGELGADETGIVARLKALKTALGRLGKIHPGAAGFAERLGAAHIELQELGREAEAERERVEGNPERLERVVARLDAIYRLQQKHHVDSVAGLLELHSRLSAQLDAIEHGDERLAALEAAVGKAEAEVKALAEQISAGRRTAATQVERSVVDMLRRLEMAEAWLTVEISPARELRANGGDEVRFLFTANTSVPPRPIEKIASGGEISRVMLALKTLAARSAGQPTVIFDEIDSGVSGRVADAMGEVIAQLGGHCQVLNITHLPQIAAKRGAHFLVYKDGGATQIRQLSEEERVTEIAKMLSGSAVTGSALDHARQLLKMGTPTTAATSTADQGLLK
ncbi:MAG: DNA repair protein RecN [Alistipes sp.]|jgi:DNA repair protein RecN (Recombination protein N)|nr:DNA repair protein RecN [Alistipes sp.]